MGSARSQKNFLDKQSETCPRISSSKKHTDMWRKVDFAKYLIFRGNSHIYGCLCTFSWIYRLLCFCIITMGSARSQKNFLDKQSETCPRISSSKKYTDMWRKVDFTKYLIFRENSHIYGCLYTFYEIFRLVDFLYNHDGLCEISEKFS